MIPSVATSPFLTPAPVKPAADRDGDNNGSVAAPSGGNRVVDIRRNVKFGIRNG
jgi:hypothetical protein